MVQVVIVGTGDFAHGISHLFSNNNCASFSGQGNLLEVTKPSIHHIQVFHNTGVAVVPMEDALYKADIVILAIPSNQLSSFFRENIHILRSKILVDVTNSTSNNRRHHHNAAIEDLRSVLGICCDHDIRWVKAFNDIGAVDVMLDKPTYKLKHTTKMCSSNPCALQAVKKFAEESLGLQVKVVPYEHYDSIATSQNSLGKEWIHSMYILLFVFAYSEFYAILRYNVYKGYAWYHIPIQITNKAICWTALTGMALAQLPGILSRIYDSYQDSNLISKPSIILWSLRLRKHLGILSFWYLILHIIMSLLIMNEKYYGKFYENPKANASKMNGMGEISFLFATLGTGLYIIMGLCSINSIGSQMTNLQWQVVYGPIAWIALIFGTLHVIVMGAKGWTTAHKWPGGLPPITMTSVLLPLFVLFLKLLQKGYYIFHIMYKDHQEFNILSMEQHYRDRVVKKIKDIDNDAKDLTEDNTSSYYSEGEDLIGSTTLSKSGRKIEY